EALLLLWGGLLEVPQVGRRRSQVLARRRRVVEDRGELAPVGGRVHTPQRGRQIRRRMRQEVGTLAQVRPYRAEHLGLFVGDPRQALGDLPEIPDRASQLL